MIIRIVKMTFRSGTESDFQAIFTANKERIRHFEGCTYLQVLNDIKDPNVFFTYSIWDSEESLDKYRDSELFKTTWAQTKALFDEKPEAWSLEQKVRLD